MESLSRFERFTQLMGDEENLPNQVCKPALTDKELAERAPNSIISPQEPLEARAFDTFLGQPYVNPHIKIVEEDEETPSSAPKRKTKVEPTQALKTSVGGTQTGSSPVAVTREASKPLTSTILSPGNKGDIAPLGIHFCPILAVSKFPYRFIATRNLEKVAEKFFNGGKFWDRHWELYVKAIKRPEVQGMLTGVYSYYVWSPHADLGKPVVFIAEHQFTSLVSEIDQALPELNVSIPKNAYAMGLITDFDHHPDLRPRYLGQSSSRLTYDELEANAAVFTMMAAKEPEDRSVAAFRAKMEAAVDIAKNKSKGARTKKKEERFVKQLDLTRQVKRAQRYLGLRPRHVGDDTLMPGLEETHPCQPISILEKVPYAFEKDAVIISIDVESFERNHSLITEIGVATLVTRDISNVAPGTNGMEWFGYIRARHFRIKEYMHLVNTDFVQGCPDNFEFGDSEIIPLKEAPKTVADCFKEPFSKSQGGEEVEPYSFPQFNAQKRNIIFLGHDVNADIAYLHRLGYDPTNLSNLLEVMDTAAMFRVQAREPNPRSLGHILYEMELAGWHLHNAGNDAVYTVQAMLAICVHDAANQGKRENIAADRAKAVEEKVLAAKALAEVKVREEAEGWSGGEEDDGGVALKPTFNIPRRPK